MPPPIVPAVYFIGGSDSGTLSTKDLSPAIVDINGQVIISRLTAWLERLLSEITEAVISSSTTPSLSADPTAMS